MPTNYTDVIPDVPDVDWELRDAITWVNETEATLIEANEERDKARAALVEVILARGDRTVIGINAEGEVFRATVVSGETTTIDADALRAKIGARAFNKLTVRKVDMKKVEEALDNGSLTPAVVAEFTTVKARATYPKLTRVDV